MQSETTATHTKTHFKSIPEYSDLSSKQFFEDLVPLQQPVILRGFAKSWPLVEAGKHSPKAFTEYLNQFYCGAKAIMAVAPPAAKKRFYYNDEMTDINFLRGEERVDLFLGRLLELVDRAVYPAISMQAASTEHLFPGLIDQNCTPFFDRTKPKLWVGNEGIVNTHYDGSDNLACVVAGRRRFVLFPPSQTKNLYPGSLNVTPAGAPTSLVDINAPDFERYPLYRDALENAYSVELHAGDAIFIPMLWWHHVESLDKVNALMNYWWNGSSAHDAISPSPTDSLNIALLAMRNLTPKQRDAWRCLFDHYLFKQGVEPCSYIPKQQQEMLGPLSSDYIHSVKEFFVNKLKK